MDEAGKGRTKLMKGERETTRAVISHLLEALSTEINNISQADVGEVALVSLF